MLKILTSEQNFTLALKMTDFILGPLETKCEAQHQTFTGVPSLGKIRGEGTVGKFPHFSILASHFPLSCDCGYSSLAVLLKGKSNL